MRRIAGRALTIAAAGSLIVSAAFADLAMRMIRAKGAIDPEQE